MSHDNWASNDEEYAALPAREVRLVRYTLRFWPQHGWVDASDCKYEFPRTDNIVYLAAPADAALAQMREQHQAEVAALNRSLDEAISQFQATKEAEEAAEREIDQLLTSKDELRAEVRALEGTATVEYAMREQLRKELEAVREALLTARAWIHNAADLACLDPYVIFAKIDAALPVQARGEK